METDGDFTVAGVAQHGDDVDREELWTDLDAYEDDLDDVAIGNDYYGVYYDIDEGSGEFTYVAGVAVDSTDDLDPELTAVDVPETTYAVFATTGEAIEDVAMEIEESQFGDVDHDRGIGVLVERYDPDVRPTAYDSDVEFLVPVDEENETDTF